jgi:hypothetical protein
MLHSINNLCAYFVHVHFAATNKQIQWQPNCYTSPIKVSQCSGNIPIIHILCIISELPLDMHHKVSFLFLRNETEF